MREREEEKIEENEIMSDGSEKKKKKDNINI